MSIRDCTVVSSPVVHYIVSCLECTFSCTSWCKPCTWPCVVCSLPKFVRNFVWKVQSPSFCDLKNRSKSFYKVQTDHSCRHLSLCQETRRESASTEVSVVSCIPCCCFEHCILIFFCYIIPGFHYIVSVCIFGFSVCIQTCSS